MIVVDKAGIGRIRSKVEAAELDLGKHVQARYSLATLLSKQSQLGGQGVVKMMQWVSFARCAHKSHCIRRVARQLGLGF